MFSLKRIWKYLFPQIKKFKWSFALVFIGYGLGVVLSSIVNPYIYKEIIDSISNYALGGISLQWIFTLVIISIGVRFVFNFFYRLGDYAITRFQSDMIESLHNYSFIKLIDHSYHFFSNNFTGSLVAKAKRFSRSFESAHDILSYNIWFALVNLVGVFLVLIWTSWPIAVFLFSWIIVYIFITVLFIRRKVKLDLAEAEADSKVTGSFADAFVNIMNIKLFAGKHREIAEFKHVTSEEKYRRNKAWNFANVQNVFQGTMMVFLFSAVTYISVYYWSKGKISVGMIVLIQLYMDNIFDQLWNLGRSLTKSMKAFSEMQEIIDIFDTVPDILDPKHPELLRMGNGHLQFNDVSFNYHGNSNVFSNFNLEIKPGERIGLVGHSGAGKSTITKLLLRFSDVTSGSITVDGQDIRNVLQDDLRNIISYVPQESILFHRSIKENIAYGKPDATDEEIIEAAKKAHAHEFIISLPKGYDTLVGERGIKLSGGERQRVAIARAMLKNAPILVLDEATSSLDSVSESYIQDAFDELMKGKTTIVIAHRLSTIQKMDRIIVLGNGTILEEGNHKKLLRKKGVYADLWEHQSGGFIE